MSPSIYRNTIFNQSARVISLGLLSNLNLYNDGISHIRAQQFTVKTLLFPLRSRNDWCYRWRQNKIREAYGKCMQKSLEADRCFQTNDPFIWNKKMFLSRICHSVLKLFSETRHLFDKNTTVKLEKFDERVLRFVINEKQTSWSNRLTITCESTRRKNSLHGLWKL